MITSSASQVDGMPEKIADASCEQLLYTILKRQGQHQAPKRIDLSGEHLDCIVGIGKDDAAQVFIDAASFQLLDDRMKKISVGELPECLDGMTRKESFIRSMRNAPSAPFGQ